MLLTAVYIRGYPPAGSLTSERAFCVPCDMTLHLPCDPFKSFPSPIHSSVPTAPFQPPQIDEKRNCVDPDIVAPALGYVGRTM